MLSTTPPPAFGPPTLVSRGTFTEKQMRNVKAVMAAMLVTVAGLSMTGCTTVDRRPYQRPVVNRYDNDSKIGLRPWNDSSKPDAWAAKSVHREWLNGQLQGMGSPISPNDSAYRDYGYDRPWNGDRIVAYVERKGRRIEDRLDSRLSGVEDHLGYLDSQLAQLAAFPPWLWPLLLLGLLLLGLWALLRNRQCDNSNNNSNVRDERVEIVRERDFCERCGRRNEFCNCHPNGGHYDGREGGRRNGMRDNHNRQVVHVHCCGGQGHNNGHGNDNGHGSDGPRIIEHRQDRWQKERRKPLPSQQKALTEGEGGHGGYQTPNDDYRRKTEARFDNIERKLDSVTHQAERERKENDARFVTVEQGLKGVREGIGGLGNRLESIEKGFEKLNTSLAESLGRINDAVEQQGKQQGAMAKANREETENLRRMAANAPPPYRIKG